MTETSSPATTPTVAAACGSPGATASAADVGVCSVCGTTAEIASRQIHQHPHEHAYRRCYECSIATVTGGRPVTCPVCGSSAGEWPPSEVTR